MEKKPQSKNSSTAEDSRLDNLDAESIMLTLDQLNQTIEVMHNVVGRLKRYVNGKSPLASQSHSAEKRALQRHLYEQMAKHKTLH